MTVRDGSPHFNKLYCNQTCADSTLDDTCLFCVCENDVVSGKVTDISGAPLKDVNIYRAENPLAVIATTDSSGYYEIHDVCVNGADLLFVKEKFITATKTTSSSRRKRQALGRLVSMRVTLERLEPLVMSEHPQNKVRYRGQSVTFCCTAKGKPAPSYYEWFKDDVILDDTIYGYNNTLTLSDLKDEDGGRYKCRANGQGGSQYSQTALLKVLGMNSEFANH
ncbi:cartilage intermediate layer protein 1-like [Ptychodera flava]|uniref:cartilage intermediate layer protein 1-like n=1 Tax=Ptychodera flava TaxID=63121 RepID=UPI00396A076F